MNSQGKIERPRNELNALLEEQTRFLLRSCAAYDKGDPAEAKRIATIIRVLVHDTRNSHSLLSQLDIKDSLFFYDTARPRQIGAITPHSGLAAIVKTDEETLDFQPQFNGTGLFHWPCMVLFSKWWQSAVLFDARDRVFTRRDLVLACTNQDGGAHVDKELERQYFDLTRDHSMGWVFDGTKLTIDFAGSWRGRQSLKPGQKFLSAPHLPSIRQLGHELLVTLSLGHSAIFKDVQIPEKVVEVDGTDFSYVADVGRNDQCPCRSGRKFKKCHGRYKGKTRPPHPGKPYAYHPGH